MSTNEPLQNEPADNNSSTVTEPQTDLASWGTGTNPDYEPAPTYEDPYKNNTTGIHEVSVNNPLGRLYSGNVDTFLTTAGHAAVTHLAYGDYHDDHTTEVTYEKTTRDPVTDHETTEIVTEERTSRSLYYHSELVTPNSAIKSLEEMPPTYNYFDREKAIEFVSELPPNANVSVAREGSPALYVWHNDIPALADKISEHFTGRNYPDELGIVDTNDDHTFPNANTGTKLRDQRSGKWGLVRMWWD